MPGCAGQEPRFQQPAEESEGKGAEAQNKQPGFSFPWASCHLCHPGQVTSPVWVSVSSVKWG